MFAVNGILFNHESPRRGPTFVTRKITRAVVRIEKGLQKTIYLGNLDAKRDWGHARDYIEGMWLMLQGEQREPEDFVLATGETYKVRTFVELAFKEIGVEIKWKGKGTDEIGYDAKDESRVLVRIDPRYFRPTEVDILIGDPSKAEKKLGWKRKTTFKQLVKEMVVADRELVKQGLMDR
jgi:GDPmannose 4,6-dehydratase